MQEWCAYLDSPDSAKVLTKDESGWLSESAYQDYQLWEYEVDMEKPHGGFSSYNAFFHRDIKRSARPVAEPNDPRVIVSTNDGYVMAVARDLQVSQPFWLKGERYSLVDIFAGNKSPTTSTYPNTSQHSFSQLRNLEVIKSTDPFHCMFIVQAK